MDIHLKFGGPWEATFNKANPSLTSISSICFLGLLPIIKELACLFLDGDIPAP